jgi:4-carboxymuconolactone decarboxylase
MEPQAYIDAMAQSRGYVPDYHKIMALHDFKVLTATNGLAQATYEEERSLDRKTKQLLFIVALTSLRAGKEFLISHVQRALDLGITSTEILEAIEIALPVAGIVAYIAGFEAWREVTAAKGIEPTIAVNQAGSGED